MTGAHPLHDPAYRPAHDGPPVLAAEGLTKTYPLPGGGRHRAADGISFALPRGGSIGIVGESGSGKTTVARMLVGLVRPDAGTVTVDDHARAPRTPRGRAARLARARDIQMVFQDPYVSLDPRLTARQCLHTALRLHGTAPRDAEQRATELLDQVGLGTRRLAPGRTDSPAASGSASPSPVRSPSIPRCSSWTRRWPRWTSPSRHRSCNCWPGSAATQGWRWCSSATIWPWSGISPTRRSVMRRGRVVEQGPTEQVLAEPAAPYTRALLAAVPHRGWDPATATAAAAAAGLSA